MLIKTSLVRRKPIAATLPYGRFLPCLSADLCTSCWQFSPCCFSQIGIVSSEILLTVCPPVISVSQCGSRRVVTPNPPSLCLLFSPWMSVETQCLQFSICDTCVSNLHSHLCRLWSVLTLLPGADLWTLERWHKTLVVLCSTWLLYVLYVTGRNGAGYCAMGILFLLLILKEDISVFRNHLQSCKGFFKRMINRSKSVTRFPILNPITFSDGLASSWECRPLKSTA